MSKQFLLALLAGAFFASSVPAADANLLERIHRAGEQRMLSQRIAKSFSQIGLNVQPFVAKQELDEATARFEANLKFLEDGADATTTPAVARLRALWQPFRSAARGVPRLPGAVWLAHQADEVLVAAEALVRELHQTSPSASRASGRLIAQASRQRMLSQRIVKAYLLLSWGDTSDLSREELESSVNEFSGALNSLRQREDNSPAAKQELDEMTQHWEWLQAALAAEGATSYRLIVAESGEAILQSAERLVMLYAKAP